LGLITKKVDDVFVCLVVLYVVLYWFTPFGKDKFIFFNRTI